MNTMNTTDISAVRLDGSRSLADIPHRPYGTASGLVRRHPSIGPLRLKGIASVRVLPDGLFTWSTSRPARTPLGPTVKMPRRSLNPGRAWTAPLLSCATTSHEIPFRRRWWRGEISKRLTSASSAAGRARKLDRGGMATTAIPLLSGRVRFAQRATITLVSDVRRRPGTRGCRARQDGVAHDSPLTKSPRPDSLR